MQFSDRSRPVRFTWTYWTFQANHDLYNPPEMTHWYVQLTRKTNATCTKIRTCPAYMSNTTHEQITIRPVYLLAMTQKTCRQITICPFHLKWFIDLSTLFLTMHTTSKLIKTWSTQITICRIFVSKNKLSNKILPQRRSYSISARRMRESNHQALLAGPI